MSIYNQETSAMRNERDIKHNHKALFIVFSLLMIHALMPLAYAGAQGGSVLDALKFNTIQQVQSNAPGTDVGDNSPDEQAAKIADALKQRLEEMKPGMKRVKGSGIISNSGQQVKIEGVRNQLSDKFNIQLRNGVGTPRQIKVKKEAKLKGMVLERASTQKAVGKDRDKETARSFLRSKRGLLRLSDPDNELLLSAYSTDALNRRHLRYQQIFKDIPVWTAELNVHLDRNGNVDLLNGAFVPTPKRMVTQPAWSEAEAIEAARAAVSNGETAKADIPLLIIFPLKNNICRLAWKIELSDSYNYDWLVIVDASNGSILTAYNQVMSDSASGSGTDLFGQNRQLSVWEDGNQYYMVDTSKNMYDETSTPPDLQNTKGAIIIMDMEHNEQPGDGGAFDVSHVTSQNANSGWLRDAVSLAHCISKTSDYYSERHNRSSLDNNGRSVLGLVRYGDNYDNAFWSSGYNALFFGDAVPYAGALDVVAHEYTHGVTSFTCDLIYQDQSGALNEAFSDIFGEMVEAYATGSTDWINGTLLNDNGRNLKDPSSVEITEGYAYPSKMSEFYGRQHPLLQQLVDQDYGGVHINMTILTHCFYLLAEGLDNAIGIRDAEKIFYRAQTVHLLSASQFIDARLACVASAEELFGEDALQVQKVKEAFDAVEIFSDDPTPAPTPTVPVNGDDSSVSVYYSSNYGAYYLVRYEEDLGDPSGGNIISCYDIAAARPSVTGDGDMVFFVDSVNDACFLGVDSPDCEYCLDMPGEISSVAMSPDGNLYGFVLLDEYGEPTNDITVVDLRGAGSEKTFPLVLPATEGESLNTVLFADTMDFTSDNRYLIYDAYNLLELADGTKLGVWSIYALDLVTEQIIPLIEPFTDLDIGFPSIAQTNNRIMTFDAVDSTTGNTSILTYDFYNGYVDIAGMVTGSWSCPGYTGDDGAIVYSTPDASTSTGFSLYRQAVGQNALTPVGDPTLYLTDADYGVVYRRGLFSSPTADISVSPTALSFGTINTNSMQTKTITTTNTGTGDLAIEGIVLSGANADQFFISGGCTGRTLLPSGACNFSVGFLPSTAGGKSAAITIFSDDSDTPVVTVTLSGTGQSSGTGQTSGFDYTAYLENNPDLPSSWGPSECMAHYKLFGFWEKRAVSFNLEEYLNANPDLPRNWTLTDALNHYNVFGKGENRLLAFDAEEYLSLYPDLPQNWSYNQAWAHYIYFGKQEGRIASFDEVAYLELYTDLPRSWGQTEAFSHYLFYGRYENRVYDPYDENAFMTD